MAHKIQIKRGNKADIPVLNDGEMGLCIDTQEVFVGCNGTNIPVNTRNGGDADTVGGFTVGVSVPAGAKFTDTITTINGKTGVISKEDIVALGIPAQDTTYNTVTTTTNGLMIATDKVKLNGIESGANKYIHPTTAGNKHIPTGGTVGQILKNTASGTATWADETDTITTINGKTGAITKADIVALGIPAQDTVYIHPSTHPASIITQDSNNRFVTDVEKNKWNGKADVSDIPTSLSQLTNDSGFITINQVPQGIEVVQNTPTTTKPGQIIFLEVV